MRFAGRSPRIFGALCAAYAGCSLYRHHRAACRLIFEKSLICRGHSAPDATAPDPHILPKVIVNTYKYSRMDIRSWKSPSTSSMPGYATVTHELLPPTRCRQLSTNSERKEHWRRSMSSRPGRSGQCAPPVHSSTSGTPTPLSGWNVSGSMTWRHTQG